MDDIGIGSLLGSPGGMLGTITAAIVTAGVLIRKFWFSDKVTSANTNAQVDMIARLQELLDKAYQRADLAEQRTDKANAERNELVARLGGMTEKIAQLTEELKEVAALREQVKSLTEEVINLRKQLKHDSTSRPDAAAT